MTLQKNAAWPTRLDQTRRPKPCGVFVVQLEEHRFLPGVDRLLASQSVVRLGPCTFERRVVQAAANSMRTVIRSCRSHERSRRSLLRRAVPTSLSAMSKPTDKVLEMWLTTKEIHTAQDAWLFWTRVDEKPCVCPHSSTVDASLTTNLHLLDRSSTPGTCV